MSVIFPPVIIGGALPVTAVTFDGTNDYLSRAALTGVSNGPVGSMSFWMRVTSDGTALNICAFAGGSYTSTIGRRVTNDLIFTLRSTGNAARVSMVTNTTITSSAGWMSILASWNTSGSRQLYVNDVSNLVAGSATAGSIGYATTTFVGAGAGASGRFNGDMAEFWFDPTTQIDFSVVANRRKFISATGKPVNLGTSGQLPTGASPALYLRGPASNWGTNSGTGGNFAVTGTFTDATPP